jgi:hypothetical protein
MLFVCVALTVIIAECTSDQQAYTDGIGGIEITLTLDAGALVAHFTTATVTMQCDGVDPITGLPWPSETFDVNLSTSEGNDPTDPKDSLGVFKKEGLPEGLCTVTITAISDDGTVRCGGQATDIPVTAGPDSTEVTIVFACIADELYGGILGSGEFNQCAEYSQIIVSPTTQSTGGDPVDVDIWCYDPNRDDALATVVFITAASSVDPNPANWVNCGSNTDFQFPPVPQACPHQDPPTVIGAESLDVDLSCNIGDDGNGDPGTPCVVIVSISDDGFAAGGTDPFGCDGTDDNANAVIPVFCQSLAVCGNGTIESPEQCDPPGAPNGNSIFCDAQCKTFDPCVDLFNPPASCAAPADPDCSFTTCSESGGVITCGIADAPVGTPCSGGPGATCQPGGVCCTCASDGDCDNGDPCTVDTCIGACGPCNSAPLADGSVCNTTGQCNAGACQNGNCTNGADSTYVCGPGGAAIKGTLTACGICEILSLGCPLWCDGTTSPAGGPAAVCGANILLLGGNGGACTTGLSGACLGCYATVAGCGTAACAASCSGSGPIGANGCTCIDCVNSSCDAAFEACSGYATGRPNGTPSATGGVIGGPPVCQAIPTPACDE